MPQIAVEIPVKRKLGRPRKDPADLLTERVDVFFSVSGRVKLHQDAKACGLSPAAYIRQLVDGYRPTAQADHGADPQLLLELNAIGNNVNQKLASLPPDHASKSAWRELKRDLQDALQIVALDGVSVSPKLLVQLNAAGTLLNRAVADMHAGSQRKHDWDSLRQTLHDLLTEAALSHVH